MSATRAFELGLVNEVVSAERLDEVVEEWVKDILLCSPMAVRATKQAAMRGLDTSLSQAFSNSTSTKQLEQRAKTLLRVH